MRKTLDKSVRYGEELDMMYMAADRTISRRRIKVLQVGEVSFRAYCYMRQSNRTFTIENVLALVPVFASERRVINEGKRRHKGPRKHKMDGYDAARAHCTIA